MRWICGYRAVGFVLSFVYGYLLSFTGFTSNKDMTTTVIAVGFQKMRPRGAMPTPCFRFLAAMAIRNRLLAIQWQATLGRGDSNAGAGRRRVL